MSSRGTALLERIHPLVAAVPILIHEEDWVQFNVTRNRIRTIEFTLFQRLRYIDRSATDKVVRPGLLRIASYLEFSRFIGRFLKNRKTEFLIPDWMLTASDFDPRFLGRFVDGGLCKNILLGYCVFIAQIASFEYDDNQSSDLLAHSGSDREYMAHKKAMRGTEKLTGLVMKVTSIKAS